MTRKFSFKPQTAILKDYILRCNQIFKNGQQTTCPTVPFDQYELQVVMQIPLTIPAFQNAIVRGDKEPSNIILI